MEAFKTRGLLQNRKINALRKNQLGLYFKVEYLRYVTIENLFTQFTLIYPSYHVYRVQTVFSYSITYRTPTGTAATEHFEDKTYQL